MLLARGDHRREVTTVVIFVVCRANRLAEISTLYPLAHRLHHSMTKPARPAGANHGDDEMKSAAADPAILRFVGDLGRPERGYWPRRVGTGVLLSTP